MDKLPLTPSGLTADEAALRVTFEEATDERLEVNLDLDESETMRLALGELGSRRLGVENVAQIQRGRLDNVREQIAQELAAAAIPPIVSAAHVASLAQAYTVLGGDLALTPVDTVEPLHRGHDAAHWYADLLEMNDAVDNLLTVTSRFGLDDFGGRLEDVAEAINTLAATRKALA